MTGGDTPNGLRLGVDIGGTFTDLVLMDEASGAIRILKTPSIPANPSSAVRNGLRELVERDGVDIRRIGYFVHGTTLATNTVIQRSGAPTGLLVTQGFRDLLGIRRLRLENPNDYLQDPKVPLVPRRWVRPIQERLLSTGREYRELDLDQVDQAGQFLTAEGVEAVAVVFLHSYKNPVHEQRAYQRLRERFPGLFVCTSSDVWPEQREYERATITTINAMLGRLMERYFSGLARDARELGLSTPVLTTKSNGGLMTAETAAERAVDTLLSGPASGVIGSQYLGGLIGEAKLITLDIGGTSADVAVVDGEAGYSTETRVGEFPVMMPAVDISTIGAGGGSIAWTDSEGVLKVGPRSAGANPGPVCYDRGGTEPTLTDAYVTLGILDPDRFLGGAMPLNAAKARAALADLGTRMGMDAVQAAASIVEVTTANMYAQFTPLMARRGADPTDFTLLAYGGAGPTHAFLLAREVGIRRVIVPPSPGLLCALGCLLADLKADFVQTVYQPVARLNAATLEEQFEALERQAEVWLDDQHVSRLAHRFVRTADMRYRGQSFEVNVRLPEHLEREGDLKEITDPFHTTYHAIYGFSDPSDPVELVNMRLTVLGVTPKPTLPRLDQRSPSEPLDLSQRRDVSYEGRSFSAVVLDRALLRAGDTLEGPTIVEQYDTTVFIPPEFTARVDEWGNVVGEVRGG